MDICVASMFWLITSQKIKCSDKIRCRECGYRIMYKRCTKRLVGFDAR
ncbi:hypothetical protein K5549_013710 [Capra hircus]|uniref:DNA-directed RNA polymerases I, II, and III subunit RPABC4 n=1 Tax=Capra hircus TaxID=9925 RepID=A0A452F2Z7_CAPHI|nr:hypothetical protein K5549_013710 [Capra hircus]